MTRIARERRGKEGVVYWTRPHPCRDRLVRPPRQSAPVDHDLGKLKRRNATSPEQIRGRAEFMKHLTSAPVLPRTRSPLSSSRPGGGDRTSGRASRGMMVTMALQSV